MLSLTVFVLMAASCDDFLDINTDPNNPTDAPLSQILPYAQLSIANSFGNGSAGMSDYTSQFVHQTTQRGEVNHYFIAPDDFGLVQAWQGIYAGALTDLRQIIDKATEEESWHYVGVAQILRAFTYGNLVDLWGNVPYSEAILGAESPFPSYDNGRDIYESILDEIDEGIENLGKSSTLSPGAEDLYFGGNIAKWRKFAKTLKLKLYNNARRSDLYDASEVNALITENDLMEADGGFRMEYGTSLSPDSRHPLFQRDVASGDPANYVSPYFYLIMKGDGSLNPILEGVSDPRIPYYFYNQLAPGEEAQNPTAFRDGDFVSIWFGSFNIDPNEGFGQNRSQTTVGLYPVGGKFDDGEGGPVGPTVGLEGAGFQRLLPYFVSLYIRAELALTAGAPGDPRALFESAMEASFAEVNEMASKAGVAAISADDIDEYVDEVLDRYDNANNNGKLEHILTQKWIASFGYGMDSYADYRRTGFPRAFDPSSDGNPNTALIRSYPRSFPYWTNELSINPNAPRQRNPAVDRVFWDN